MWYFKFYKHRNSLLWFLTAVRQSLDPLERGKLRKIQEANLSDNRCKARRTLTVTTILCIVIVASMLTACGSATTGQVPHSTKTPTSTSVPTPTPTATPTLVPTPPPTQAPVPAQPAILDLQPASMSLLGHRDCQKNTAYVCLARVLSRASNQSDLNWSTYTDVPGHIVFNPASGNLPPGQSVVVTITVPLNACTPGLFYFRGPINTHTITWAC